MRGCVHSKVRTVERKDAGRRRAHDDEPLRKVSQKKRGKMRSRGGDRENKSTCSVVRILSDAHTHSWLLNFFALRRRRQEGHRVSLKAAGLRCATYQTKPNQNQTKTKPKPKTKKLARINQA